MIHDQSSTGSTLFIEPMSVVRLNNDLKELFLREKEEIQVILANLSNLTAEYIPYLRDDYKLLSGLDFIFARARLKMVQGIIGHNIFHTYFPFQLAFQWANVEENPAAIILLGCGKSNILTAAGLSWNGEISRPRAALPPWESILSDRCPHDPAAHF